MAQITPTRTVGLPVWRVGFKTDPWKWTGWQCATNGRFSGRWDDAEGIFRTLYVGETLLGCLLEVLAPLRPDPLVTDELNNIVDNDDSNTHYPTIRPGQLSREWLRPRYRGHALLTGDFCDVTAAHNIAATRPRFIGMAHHLGLADYDAAALKDLRARPLTQAIATYLYGATAIDGVSYRSRHGDDHRLWSIFERPVDLADSHYPPCLHHRTQSELTGDEPEFEHVFRLYRLHWA